MSRYRDPKRYVAIGTLFGIAAFVGIVFALVPAGRREVIEVGAQRAAARRAQTYSLTALRALSLPSGLRTVYVAPGPAGSRALHHSLRHYVHRLRVQRYRNAAQAHGFWIGNVPPAQVLSSLAAHPPPGTVAIRCRPASCLIYTAPTGSQLGPAEVGVSATVGKSGQTLIHAVAIATWSPFPQMLPEGVSALTVTVLPLEGQHREEHPLYGPQVISKPASLRLIVRTIGLMQQVSARERAPCHRSPKAGEVRLSFTQGVEGASLAGMAFRRFQCAPLTLTTEDNQTAVHLQEVPRTFRARRVLTDALALALGVRLPGT